jgi:hypothetical protein
LSLKIELSAMTNSARKAGQVGDDTLGDPLRQSRLLGDRRELSNGSTAVAGLSGNGSAGSLSPRQRPALGADAGAIARTKRPAVPVASSATTAAAIAADPRRHNAHLAKASITPSLPAIAAHGSDIGNHARRSQSSMVS